MTAIATRHVFKAYANLCDGGLRAARVHAIGHTNIANSSIGLHALVAHNATAKINNCVYLLFIIVVVVYIIPRIVYIYIYKCVLTIY